jgi:hypothetical protein
VNALKNVSKLTDPNDHNSLFLKKNGPYNLACSHQTSHTVFKVMPRNFMTRMQIFRRSTCVALTLYTYRKKPSFCIFALLNNKPVIHTFPMIFYTILLCGTVDVEYFFLQNVQLCFVHDMYHATKIQDDTPPPPQS